MTQPTRHLHTFFAVKGGQGTTVVAAAAALVHAQAGRRTLLIDAADNHDTYAALGLPEPVDPTELVDVTPNLDLRSIEPGTEPDDVDDYDVVIVDAGQHQPTTGTATLVTRACYLALRRAITLIAAPDNIVVVQEPGRALSGADVAAVLNAHILATIAVDPAIARVVDAGLLATRLPAPLRHLRDALATLEDVPT
jgi:hypothetical protein